MTRATARSVLVVMLAACGPDVNPARIAIDQQAKPSTKEAGWTCPMHADVRAEAPGPCPICGMALVLSPEHR